MAGTRSVARQIETQPWSTFEDQLWPINVALVVLGAFVAGAIIGTGHFDEPRILWNAWTHLGTLVISLAGFVWLAAALSNQRLRRSLQLSALLSLIGHLALLTVLYNQRLTIAVAVGPGANDEFAYEFPSDDVWPTQLPAAEPVADDLQAVTAAEVVLNAAPLVARSVPAPAVPLDQGEPVSVSDLEPQIAPSLLEMRSAPQAASRPAAESSVLSRQSALLPPLPDVPIAEPALADTSPGSTQLAPAEEFVRRQSNVLAVDRPQETSSFDPAALQQAMQLNRRETADAPTAASSLSSLERAPELPLGAPRADIDSPSPVAVGDAAATDLQPGVALVKAQAIGVEGGPMGEIDSPSGGPGVAGGGIVRRTMDERPEIASSPGFAGRMLESNGGSPTAFADDAPGGSGGAADEGDGTVVARETNVNRATSSPGLAASAAISGDGALPALSGVRPGPGGGSLSRAEQSSRDLAANAGTVGTNAAVPLARATTAGGVVGRIDEVGMPVGNADGNGSAAGVDGLSGPAGGGAAEAQRQSAGGVGSKADSGSAGGDGSIGLAGTAAAAPIARAETSGGTPGSAGGSGGTLARSGAGAVAGANLAGAALLDPLALPGNTSTGGGTGGIPAGGEAGPGASSIAVTRGAGGGLGGGGLGVGGAGAAGDIGGEAGGFGAGGIPGPVGLGRPAAGRNETIGVPNGGSAPLGKGRAAAGPFGSGGSAADPGTPAGGSGTGLGAGGGAGQGSGSAGPLGDTAVARQATGIPGGRGGTGNGTGNDGPELLAGAGGSGTGGLSSLSRAPAADAAPGPQPGGGGGLGGRTIGRVFAANAGANAPESAKGTGGGLPAGDSSPAGVGSIGLGSAAGIAGPAGGGSAGIARGAMQTETPISGSPGVGLSAKPTRSANSDAPNVANLATAGTLGKANIAGLPGGTAQAASESKTIGPPATAGAIAGPRDTGDRGPVLRDAPALPRRTGALPVQIAASEGPGGLGSQWSPDVGTLARRSVTDNTQVNAGTSRFLGRASGGPLAIDGRAREPAEAFANRRAGRGGDAANRPSQRTERAVELGLAFLARHQAEDGRWSFHNYSGGRRGYEAPATLRSDTAATGLSLLALLGAGYDHFGDQYQQNVASGLAHLLSHQQPTGDLYLPEDDRSNENMHFYSHGIATIALCEAYGMTGDPDLAEPAQKAIDFIVASQNRQTGGWRYKAQVSADTSVTGWQLMALKSGDLAGLKVPPEAYDMARKWLDTAAAPSSGGSQYVYDPFAAKVKGVNNGVQVGGEEGRKPNRVMTAVGLLMRMYLGWNRDTPAMRQGADYLAMRQPALGTRAEPSNDAYYWYYTTQVMFHMRGEYWRVWNERLHALLVERQVQNGPLAGSWEPLGAVPDRWGPQAGRIYVTTLNLLSLEVTYRHLPIYESTAK